MIKVADVKPLNDKVLILPDDNENKSPGGIVMPGNVRERPTTGIVVAVGPGRWEYGARVPMSVKRGDRVKFTKHGGEEIEYEGQKYMLLVESAILFVI